jgi:hypothetical protein
MNRVIKSLQTNRINNISLFVTVLSTCIGLLSLGLPPQVHASTPQTLNDAGAIRAGALQANALQEGDGRYDSTRFWEIARDNFTAIDIDANWLSDLIGHPPSPVLFDLHKSDTEFYASVSFTQNSIERANKNAGAFNQHLAHELNSRNEDTADLEYLLYRNARAVANNSQVRIVTRLPRASIDALIASHPTAN